MSDSAGSCYGYDIRSKIPLRYLRRSGGEPLEVVTHRVECPTPDARLWEDWPAQENETVHVRTYLAGDTVQMWFEGDGWFIVEPSRSRIAVPADHDDPVRLEERLFGMPVMLCFVARGDIPLHAAAVDTGHGALLIGAPSEHGKTTLSAGFWREGYRVLTEDLACIRLGDRAEVLPGPASLRLRQDVAAGMGMPTRPGAPNGARTRVPVLQDDDDDDSSPVPLRGVVMLTGTGDEISLTPVPTVEAIRLIWELVVTLEEPFDSSRCFAAVADLASALPVWELTRPMTLESLPKVVAELVARA